MGGGLVSVQGTGSDGDQGQSPGVIAFLLKRVFAHFRNKNMTKLCILLLMHLTDIF